MLIGLIPDCDLAQVSSAGNAAGTGARLACDARIGAGAARIQVAVAHDGREAFTHAARQAGGVGVDRALPEVGVSGHGVGRGVPRLLEAGVGAEADPLRVVSAGKHPPTSLPVATSCPVAEFVNPVAYLG